MTNSNHRVTIDVDSPNGLSDLDNAVDTPSSWLKAALSVSREEGFINTGDCSIRYFRWGDTAKPGIVMLHGFLAHARCFAFIAPYLAANYHVVAYDMSGMGDSGSREVYSDDIRVKELMQVAEYSGLFNSIHKPVIIAHSYGGRVGACAMHAHPDRFAGIAICDLMVLRPSVLEANADKFKPPGNQKTDRPNRVYADFASAKKRFILAPPQEVEVPELFDFMAYHSLKKVVGGWQWKFDPGVFKRDANFESSWSRIGERIVTIPGRKAIVHGKESLLFNADSADYLRELIDEMELSSAQHTAGFMGA